VPTITVKLGLDNKQHTNWQKNCDIHTSNHTFHSYFNFCYIWIKISGITHL